MSNILFPLIKKGWVKNYLDNIIVWVDSFEELTDRLNTSSAYFTEKRIKLNLSKISFARREVKFLGHSSPSTVVDQAQRTSKPLVIWSFPKMLKKLCNFLECVDSVTKIFQILPRLPYH